MWTGIWLQVCIPPHQICTERDASGFHLITNYRVFSQLFCFISKSTPYFHHIYSQNPTLPSTKKAKLWVTHQNFPASPLLFLSFGTFSASKRGDCQFWANYYNIFSYTLEIIYSQLLWNTPMSFYLFFFFQSLQTCLRLPHPLERGGVTERKTAPFGWYLFPSL